MKKMTQSSVTKIVIAFAISGALLSLYTWLYKYGVASGEFCTISETFNCDVVNQSKYSIFFGVPVSALGVIGYSFIALAAWMKLKTPKDKSVMTFLTIVTLGALTFSFYLSSIEAFVLNAWCILCLGNQAIILVLTWFVYKLRTYDK